MHNVFLKAIGTLILIFGCEAKKYPDYSANTIESGQETPLYREAKKELSLFRANLQNYKTKIKNITKIDDLDIFQEKIEIGKLKKLYNDKKTEYSYTVLPDRTLYNLLESTKYELDELYHLIEDKQRELLKYIKISSEDSEKLLSQEGRNELEKEFTIIIGTNELTINKISKIDKNYSTVFFGKYNNLNVAITKRQDYQDQLTIASSGLTAKIHEVFKDQNNNDWVIMEKLDETDDQILAPENPESKNIIVKAFKSLKSLQDKIGAHRHIGPHNLLIQKDEIKFIDLYCTAKFFSSARRDVAALAKTILHYRFKSLIEKNIRPVLIKIHHAKNYVNKKVGFGNPIVKIKNVTLEYQKLHFYHYLFYSTPGNLPGTIDLEILKVLHDGYLINPNKKTEILKTSYTEYTEEDFVEYIDTLSPPYNNSMINLNNFVNSNPDSFDETFNLIKKDYEKNFWVNHDNIENDSGLKKILKTYCNYNTDKFDEFLMKLADDTYGYYIDIDTAINSLEKLES